MMTEENRHWIWEPPEGGVIGKRGVRRIDGLAKVSGNAIYTRDINLPGKPKLYQASGQYCGMTTLRWHGKVTR
jgi:hypothetical protein